MDQHYRILTGDVSDQLANLPDNFFDAVLSDPPYGLSFMGKEWDKGVPSAEAYGKLLRVLKPGAFGLHFGGTRMWHRLAVSLEDAGFELRDTVMWLYGSGFPKSHNISKALDKHGGQAVGWFGPWLRKWRTDNGITQKQVAALFPSKTGQLTGCVANWELGLNMPTAEQFSLICEKFGLPFASIEEAEREVVGEETKARSTSGKSALPTVGGSTVYETWAITAPATAAAKLWEGWGTALKPAWEPALLVQKPLAGTFANNALTHGCGGLNIEGCRVGCEIVSVHNAPAGSFAGGELGRGSDTTSYSYNTGRFPANLILDEEAGEALDAQSGTRPGGPSRFFYCAKASTKERNAGLGEGFEIKAADHRSKVSAGLWTRVGVAPAKNNHPTLKPIALTEYLAKLLLVPARADCQPRRILVPFSGAGSEMIGALKAGWDEVWGIEINPEYVAIAEARIKHHVPEAAPLDCPDLGDAA